MAAASDIQNIFNLMGTLDCAWAESHISIAVIPGNPTFAVLTRDFDSTNLKLMGSVSWGSTNGADFDITVANGNLVILPRPHGSSINPVNLTNIIEQICDAANATLLLKQSGQGNPPFTHIAPKFLAYTRSGRRASQQTTETNLGNHANVMSQEFRDFFLAHYNDGLVCHAR